MKYRIRSIIFSLAAGGILSISSCREKPAATLLASTTLADFPSASAIEFMNNRIVVFGDDAPVCIFTDTAYTITDSVRLSSHQVRRLTANDKADIESATFLNDTLLLALSSFSTPSRNSVLLLPVNDPSRFRLLRLVGLSRLLNMDQLNLEGCAVVATRLVMASRAHRNHPFNRLVLAGWNLQDGFRIDSPRIQQLELPGTVKGVSGLFYLASKDILFFTASEENTGSVTEDGIITGSHLGWINGFAGKMNKDKVHPDHMIDLTLVDPAFMRQKIEGICIERVSGHEVILHLAADNDDGKSRLFRLRLAL